VSSSSRQRAAMPDRHSVAVGRQIVVPWSLGSTGRIGATAHRGLRRRNPRLGQSVRSPATPGAAPRFRHPAARAGVGLRVRQSSRDGGGRASANPVATTGPRGAYAIGRERRESRRASTNPAATAGAAPPPIRSRQRGRAVLPPSAGRGGTRAGLHQSSRDGGGRASANPVATTGPRGASVIRPREGGRAAPPSFRPQPREPRRADTAGLSISSGPCDYPGRSPRGGLSLEGDALPSATDRRG
jgi:hypothetical protein